MHQWVVALRVVELDMRDDKLEICSTQLNETRRIERYVHAILSREYETTRVINVHMTTQLTTYNHFKSGLWATIFSGNYRRGWVLRFYSIANIWTNKFQLSETYHLCD